MANTEVHFESVDGALEPDVSSVNVVAGDSVTFFADPDAGVLLCMSPATAAFLTPSPNGSVSIAAGQSATFQFSAAEPGVYSVVVMPDGSSCPPIDDQPGGTSASLSIQEALLPVSSGPGDGGPQT
jgi:hypothetical protein